jgi:hypothetical protein
VTDSGLCLTAEEPVKRARLAAAPDGSPAKKELQNMIPNLTDMSSEERPV